MATSFTYFSGSSSGDIVPSNGSRTPGPTEAIVSISHCGVCGTDEHYRHASMGLGHEGVGVITELGSQAAKPGGSEFKVGDRVGMGWFQRYWYVEFVVYFISIPS
jgi:D-arabinose 1-dehydrogenase-like Zn-dependent alcohol dehydrogenase